MFTANVSFSKNPTASASVTFVTIYNYNLVACVCVHERDARASGYNSALAIVDIRAIGSKFVGTSLKLALAVVDISARDSWGKYGGGILGLSKQSLKKLEVPPPFLLLVRFWLFL
jgi:hypothetical protein